MSGVKSELKLISRCLQILLAIPLNDARCKLELDVDIVFQKNGTIKYCVIKKRESCLVTKSQIASSIASDRQNQNFPVNFVLPDYLQTGNASVNFEL